jgi:ferredoxin
MLRGRPGLSPRTTQARPVIDAQTCTGCGWCLPVCEPHVLGLVVSDLRGPGSKQSVLLNSDACTGCAHCAVRCPHDAIRMVQAAVERPKA